MTRQKKRTTRRKKEKRGKKRKTKGKKKEKKEKKKRERKKAKSSSHWLGYACISVYISLCLSLSCNGHPETHASICPSTLSTKGQCFEIAPRYSSCFPFLSPK